MSVYDEDEGWIGLTNALFAAKSEASDLQALVAERAIDHALTEVENAFCKADRALYKEWALAISIENGLLWEPCAEWDKCDCYHEGDDWEPCERCQWIELPETVVPA